MRIVAAPLVIACTLCDSPRASLVRDQLFGDRFAPNLAVALLPFAVMVLVLVAVHLLGGRLENRPDLREDQW